MRSFKFAFAFALLLLIGGVAALAQLSTLGAGGIGGTRDELLTDDAGVTRLTDDAAVNTLLAD